jgi:hypothetical protein
MSEWEDVDVWPLRAFRIRRLEGEPKVRLVQLSSGPDGNGVVHTYAVSSLHLRQIASELMKHAAEIDRAN